MPAPTTRSDLVVSPRPNGDGVLVYDPTTDTGHVLEGLAASVFAACDGTTDVDRLAARVSLETGATVDPSAVDVALGELVDSGLLESGRLVSRRLLIGGLVAGAAAIAAAPLITSIARPAAATTYQPMPPGATVDPATATTTMGTAVQIPLTSTGLTTATAVYWAVTQPTNGTVVITNTQSAGDNTGAYATYTPDAGFVGADSFTFTAGECFAAPGTYTYPAPPGTDASCPATMTISGTYVVPATVSITVTSPPTTSTSTSTTTTPPVEETTPKYTG